MRLPAATARETHENSRFVKPARLSLHASTGVFHWSVAAAFIIVAIASGRIASTYKVLNFTIDEPAHIACGMQWLDAGVYRYEVQHPPLARVVAALGVRYAGGRYDGDTSMWSEGFRLLV